MNEIKISIVVCSYNQEKYIRQTLDSIINQKHPFTWELIVCDDASKDSTPEIITEYANQYSQIVPILRENNLGVVKNLFDGISRCRGEYIMICGGDDYYIDDKILKQINYLEQNREVGLVHSDVQTIDEFGNKKNISFGRSYSSLKDLLRKYSVKAPTLAFRKKDLDNYIEEVNPIEQKWLMEDVPISLWFMANKKMAYLPGTYVNYRIIDNSISHQKSAEKLYDFEKSAFSVLTYFQKKYAEELPLKFIYQRHLINLLKRQPIVEHYTNYCNEVLFKLQNLDKGKSYIIFKNRIKYPRFNLFVLLLNKLKRGIKKILRIMCADPISSFS